MKKSISFLVLLTLILGCTDDSDTEPEIITEKKYTVSISITPADGGSVSPNGGEFIENQQVQFQVSPNEYYEFTGWSGEWSGTENPLTLTIDENFSLTVNFSLKDTDEDGVTDNIDQCPNTPPGEEVNETGCTLSPIYLDENGVTIKSHPWGQIGETGEVNGITYTIVDETMLRQMVENGEDVTTVCTSKVTNMSIMFKFSQFNQDISSWDVSKVTDMNGMFWGSQFNGDISKWDVSNVTDMNHMFTYFQFNGDISKWDVSNVTNMNNMFADSQFNGDISKWDVSNVTNMGGMFSAGSQFNQYIGDWDVSRVTNMSNMFWLCSFNQDISNWDVSKVTDMSGMFVLNPSFNQDLSSWIVSNVTQCGNFSLGAIEWTLPKPNFTSCVE